MVFFIGLAALAILFASVPGFRAASKKFPRVLFALPIVAGCMAAVAAGCLAWTLELPLAAVFGVAALSACATAYWGCGVTVNEFLRDVRF